ncbi:DMT family transporter [Janthinobacterium sp. HH01]|uniref:DMT family transporter n=1 Tax=Janthinobacterium sp. HH01 TaxID=1198452 RepID=UPI00034A9BF1|nr:DMT family transporter [Janthinobacterium sp. HH01]
MDTRLRGYDGGHRLSDETTGMLLGLIAVAIFSLTLPFTRLAVGGGVGASGAGLSPTFVALGRALVAAVLAGGWLAWKRAPLPPRSALLPLAMVAVGCIIGFPWLTSIAMRSLPAAHGAVLVGILPLATAVFGAVLAGEKPSSGFWLMASIGSALVVGFALRQSGGSLHWADLAIFLAVLLAAMGYAAGGRLSQSLGGQQTICWALVLSAPVLLPLVAWLCRAEGAQLAAASTSAWSGFAYVSVFSMFIGFFFWYRGMALGGVARVGQVQLVQPFLSLLGAAVVLGEALEWPTVVFAIAVIAVVGTGRKMQVKRG